MTKVSSTPPHRNQLGIWLNEQGLIGSMAEIGCAFGGFARIVLSQWQGARYHMIDPWTVQDPSVYKERQEEAWKCDHWFRECTELAEQDKRVVVMRQYSHAAALLIDDESMDCCYLDGNHCLEAVESDLKDWYPKVKPGGLFGGHDFYDAMTDGYWNQAKTAVMQWVEKNGYTFDLTPCSSWWMRK